MKNKINKNMIILVGQTGSGKTTTAKALENVGYKRMVTYTTRKPRPEEVDGEDYHFISEEKFLEMISNDEFAEYTEYDTLFGHIYYGSTKEAYNTSEKTVIVLNPEGLKMVKRNLIPSLSILLDVSDDEILKRTSKRGDNIDEVKRRLKDDAIKFENIRKYVDVIMVTNSLPTNTIIHLIKGIIGKTQIKTAP